MAFGKIVIAATVMAAVSLAVHHEVNRVAPGMRLFSQAARLAAAIGTGVIALAAMAKMLRIAELDDALALLQLRVRKLLGGSL